MSKPVFLCLDVLNTGIQETVENKPVFLLLRCIED